MWGEGRPGPPIWLLILSWFSRYFWLVEAARPITVFNSFALMAPALWSNSAVNQWSAVQVMRLLEAGRLSTEQASPSQNG